MMILAIDPGTKKSGYMYYDPEHGDGPFLGYGWVENEALIERIVDREWMNPCEHIVIEEIAGAHGGAGRDMFTTSQWGGQFAGAFRPGPHTFVTRSRVCGHVCGRASSGDRDIKFALIDRFDGYEKAIGSIKCKRCKGKGWNGRGRATCVDCGGTKWEHPPGPLRGMNTHVLDALAVAVTYAETMQEPAP